MDTRKPRKHKKTGKLIPVPTTASILKNVPLELMDEINKHQTINSEKKIRWKFREPIPPAKFGSGGSLKREDARSADMYVDIRWDRTWEHNRIKELQEQANRLAGERDSLNTSLGNLMRNHQALKEEFDNHKVCTEGSLGELDRAYERIQTLEAIVDRTRASENTQYTQLEKANKQIADLKAVIVKLTESQAFMAKYL